MRELSLGGLLALAAALVVIGVAMFSKAAGCIAAGVFVAALAWLWFGEVE